MFSMRPRRVVSRERELWDAGCLFLFICVCPTADVIILLLLLLLLMLKRKKTAAAAASWECVENEILVRFD